MKISLTVLKLLYAYRLTDEYCDFNMHCTGL